MAEAGIHRAPRTQAARRSLPAGATDCHVHVFDPERFPFAEDRGYTPGAAQWRDLGSFLSRRGLHRAVLVQPSIYGRDNRCLVDALGQLGPKAARGVAVVDPDRVSDDQLLELRGLGVAGVRVNLRTGVDCQPAAAVSAVSETIARVASLDFIVQVYAPLSLLPALEKIFINSPVPVVLDHFAGARVSGLEQTSYDVLRGLLGDGHVWLKLSAPYHVATQELGYPGLDIVGRELIQTNPDRVVWGSDWPHTLGACERRTADRDVIEPFRVVDDARVLELLAVWARDQDTYRKILVDNAAHLFRF